MSPQLITQPNTRRLDSQRPWRPVEHRPRQVAGETARTYCAPVVRELPPRREHRGGLGAW